MGWAIDLMDHVHAELSAGVLVVLVARHVYGRYAKALPEGESSGVVAPVPVSVPMRISAKTSPASFISATLPASRVSGGALS